MKTAVLAFAVVSLFLSCRAAFAEPSTPDKLGLDASFALIGAERSDLGFSYGYTIGISRRLSSISEKLQGRVDIGFYSWPDTSGALDSVYSRTPIVVSGRYYYAGNYYSSRSDYTQLGLEYSMDKTKLSGPTSSATSSENNIGLAAGAGGSRHIGSGLSFIYGTTVHMIQNWYIALYGGLELGF